jgi:hypothetical protein
LGTVRTFSSSFPTSTLAVLNLIPHEPFLTRFQSHASYVYVVLLSLIYG